MEMQQAILTTVSTEFFLEVDNSIFGPCLLLSQPVVVSNEILMLSELLFWRQFLQFSACRDSGAKNTSINGFLEKASRNKKSN